MKPLLAILSLFASASIAGAQAVSTAFTFQGRLSNANTPAAGLYDLRFHIFDALTGGAEQATALCADNIAVADGYFTVQLDFGTVFRGDQTFIEVEVRADTGLSCTNTTGYTTLLPRQQVTAAPNALFALAAQTAANADSATTAINAVQFAGQPAPFYQNAANLSSGTLASARLSGTYSAALTLNNPANSLFGSGLNLTALNATNIASGVLADARLSANIPRLNGTNAFTGIVTLSNGGNSFTGTGAGLTGLNAANITAGLLSPARGGTGADNSVATSGQVLKFNGAAWVPGIDNDTTYGAGSGLTLSGTTFSVPTGGLTGAMILDGTITAADIGPGAVGTSEIADNSISNLDLASDAQSMTKVSGGAIAVASGNVGVGGVPPAGDRLFVQGNAAVSGSFSANTLTISPVSRIYTVTPFDFVNAQSHIHDMNNPAISNSASASTVYAPVHLPNGSTVTRMFAEAINIATNGQITIYLIRRESLHGGGGGTMAQASTFNSPSAYFQLDDTTIAAPVIDNDLYMYFVRIDLPGDVLTEQSIVGGVRLTYTISAPLP